MESMFTGHISAAPVKTVDNLLYLGARYHLVAMLFTSTPDVSLI